MLAKIWKKLLLAICIIACLFNITGKIVNRHSLKLNLEAINDGSSAFNFKTFKEQEAQKTNVIEGVVNNGENDENSAANNGSEGSVNNVVIDNGEEGGLLKSITKKGDDSSSSGSKGLQPPKYQEVENPIVVEDDGRSVLYNKNK